MINKNGFTLIEILVASTLMITIGLAVLGLQFVFTQSETTAFNTYENVSQANSIASEFMREMRKSRQSENGAFALETLDDNEIAFYSDVDFDSVVERVRYSLSNNVLEKGITEPVGNPAMYPVANESVVVKSTDVTNLGIPLFFYYNSGWPEDTANNPLPVGARFSDTQLIRIFVSINNIGATTQEEYTIDSFVQPRNLKNNP